jgi:predicted anti-sigma-YlaC factor YlaD
MGLHLRRATPCERATRSISLRLDGELSELEVAALDRHLVHCPGCHTFAARTLLVTKLLRDEPPIAPRRRIVVHSPRRARARLVRRTTAAVALAGVLASATVLAVISRPVPATPSSALVFRNVHEQRQFARGELLRLEPRAELAVQIVPQSASRLLGRGLL